MLRSDVTVDTTSVVGFTVDKLELYRKLHLLPVQLAPLWYSLISGIHFYKPGSS
jgi:hypothetical protein